MILVLFLFILFVIILIFFSYIKIDCQNLKISNIPKFKYEFKINIGIYLFNKIKILGITLSKEKIKQSRIANLIRKQLDNKKIEIPLQKDNLKIAKNLKINLEKLDTNLKIGTEDVILTSAIVGTLGAIIGIILGKAIKQYEEDKYKYVILPYYTQKNIFELELTGIISTKIVHIIYVIYMFSKKRSELEYERTSNRRSYDYSYE